MIAWQCRIIICGSELLIPELTNCSQNFAILHAKCVKALLVMGAVLIESFPDNDGYMIRHLSGLEEHLRIVQT